jgi:hypothetical protein
MTNDNTLPVYGGPRDGDRMPASGPTRYHCPTGMWSYWYDSRGDRWVFVGVTDQTPDGHRSLPPRPANGK